jgi:hypothetical protein
MVTLFAHQGQSGSRCSIEPFGPFRHVLQQTGAGVGEMLPPQIADFAFDAGERMGIQTALVAIAALGACAAVIDDGFKIQPKRRDTRLRESARLWVMFNGAPAAVRALRLARQWNRFGQSKNHYKS